jgi:hypothetical protein
MRMADMALDTDAPIPDKRRARSARARRLGLSGLAIALLMQISCVVLPVQFASGVSGHVVDGATGAPIADALVVVRFEGHYGNVLPDRALLGHREGRTDASGRFSIGAIVRPGFSVWPAFQTQGRVVAVIKDGYQCARPSALRPRRDPASNASGVIQIGLDVSRDSYAQRQTCRPVPAAKGEAVEYMTAWRALYPDGHSTRDSDHSEIDRVLTARSAFGFGQNCRGPVLDLALAPDGQRAAFVAAGDTNATVQLIELEGSRTATTVAHEIQSARRRLVWTQFGDLVLWEPAPKSQQLASPSGFSTSRFEQVWPEPGPARAATDTRRVDSSSTLDPINWTDENDARWLGRSFVLNQLIDPKTGLPADELRIHRDDGSIYTLALPGEPCGSPGRFGRPQYRIAADGRSSLDLRFVEGGCHVVRTDLETGKWNAIDGIDEPGVCSASRRVPATHFSAALRGYVRELETMAANSGADPAAAYVLRIETGGHTRLDTRNFQGEIVTIDVPAFPLTTPLRRIEVSILGSVPHVRSKASVQGLEPL